ncbi:MAG: leucine-rich repeat protein [Verrucomicrobiales bacterium]|nr:leucine-rich repeat protein [Verrucomicrobiales bacterium]
MRRWLEITLPDGVTALAQGLFSGCTALTGIELPAALTHVGNSAFANCSSLVGISLPDAVTEIGDGAFLNCTGLLGISLPSGVRKIGDWAFQDCMRLAAIAIPESVYSIGVGAFSGCQALTTVTVPGRLSSLSPSTFRDCTGLTEVVFAEGLRGLPSGVLAGCTSLQSVTIPSSVMSIDSFAFRDCISLRSVILPVPLIALVIDYLAFAHCENLGAIRFEGDAPKIWGDGSNPATWEGPAPFEGSPAVVLYYRPGTAGWESIEGRTGRPTVPWIDPPRYDDWLLTTALAAEYPEASGESDDPDGDGLNNHEEMLAGTSPTDPNSVLELEPVPRPDDLTEQDRQPLGPSEHAVYARTIPGKSYAVQWANTVEGPWHVDEVVTATTAQKRFVLPKPTTQGLYQVILAQ